MPNSKEVTIGVLGLLAINLTACGVPDELEPSPGMQDLVDARATHERDLSLTDDTGRRFPARIYFNDAALPIAERFAYVAKVVTQAREELVPIDEQGHPSGEDSADGEPGLVDLPDGSPWIYVTTGQATDGTRSFGWTAQLSDVSLSRRVQQGAAVSSEDVEDEGPSYSALDTDCTEVSPCGYGFYVDSTDTQDIAGHWGCEDGMTVNGSCNYVFGGSGVARLRNTADQNRDSELYICTGTPTQKTYMLTYAEADQEWDVFTQYSSGNPSWGGGSTICHEG